MNKKTSSDLDKYEKMESQIRQWRDAHPKATLTEIEEAVEKELAELREAVVESLVQEEDTEWETLLCPHCQSKMVKNGKKKRRLKTKEGKTITLERQQMRCLTCGMTLFPPGQ
ncbi:MAG: transposase family protein [Ardenticatenaceae bacterium]|nr:transposase family protein [Ardenticatenaceae bacterium]